MYKIEGIYRKKMKEFGFDIMCIVWMDNQPRRIVFPRLSALSQQTKNLIKEMGKWVNGVWK